MRSLLALVAIPLALASLVGCGGPKFVPVEGNITANGKPLDKIMIEFWPMAEGPRSFGETDAQGHYKLTTDDGKQVGAIVGTHKVTLKDSAVLGDKFMGRKAETMDITGGRKSRIAATYNSAEKTPLTKSVEAKGNNTFDIEASAK